MRTLALDGRTGASGDMLLGALLAAGADRSALAPVERALAVRYDVRSVVDHGIAATDVTVRSTADRTGSETAAADRDGAAESDRDEDVDGDRNGENGRASAGAGHSGADAEGERDDADTEGEGGDADAPDHHDGRHGHADDHGHDHAAGHGHQTDHGHAAEGAGPHRTYDEVVSIVEGMDLPAAVERDALATFELLGEAEAAVHGTDLDGTAFHEVGADDAIADVVGACALVESLAVERIVTTPPAAGGGEVSMSHGVYPVPAPAVVEIAERADWSLRGGPVDVELLTPTGAALLATLAEGVDRLPALRVEASGYGAGDLSLAGRPNVLRALVGTDDGGLVRDDVTVLETNLDDATPEVLGGLRESLSGAGALDVSVLPATMKKSRPGHLVKVICDPADAERLARRLAEETGTLGVREHGAGHRWIAEREVRTVELSVDGTDHEVDVKFASTTEGTVFDVSAEYDDARAVAEATGLAVRDVLRRAETVARERAGLDPGPD